MRIHTVKTGDTVWNIARKYSVAPAKIIEYNGLENPDRLSVGRKLMIFSPTRTHTVRGGDTLESIALRYAVTRDEIIGYNPVLEGGEKIYPGQILAVKFSSPEYGLGAANGYFTRGCDASRLSAMLPYLTYVTFPSCRYSYERLTELSAPGDALRAVRESGRFPIMRIFCDKDTKISCENFVKSAIARAECEGYSGICIATPEISKSPREFSEPLFSLKRKLMEHNLLLFTELDGNRYQAGLGEISEICDTVILNYEKGHLPDMPSFRDGEERLLTEYAMEAECQKTLLDLSCKAYINDEPLEIGEAYEIARRSGSEIGYDEEARMSFFHTKRYSRKEKDEVRICFEAAENTKAKLDLLGELGYMGISFDIKSVPCEQLMLFYTSFHLWRGCIN